MMLEVLKTQQPQMETPLFFLASEKLRGLGKGTLLSVRASFLLVSTLHEYQVPTKSF
jgi:hypothetical protein